jgi:hypothetical protein
MRTSTLMDVAEGAAQAGVHRTGGGDVGALARISMVRYRRRCGRTSRPASWVTTPI